jgi:hypothetical protein
MGIVTGWALSGFTGLWSVGVLMDCFFIRLNLISLIQVESNVIQFDSAARNVSSMKFARLYPGRRDEQRARTPASEIYRWPLGFFQPTVDA